MSALSRTPIRIAAAAIAALTALAVAPASSAAPRVPRAPTAASAQHPPCEDLWDFTQPALSDYKAVTLDQAHKKGSYVLGPKNPGTTKRPAIVLLHGAGGDACRLWWLARDLAGRGYITLTVSYGTPATYDAQGNELTPDDGYSEDTAVAAGHRALRWLLNSQFNPYHGLIKRDRMAVIGHSLGAHAAAEIQETSTDFLAPPPPAASNSAKDKKKAKDALAAWQKKKNAGEPIRTIVALDNLRAYIKRDRSSATSCGDESDPAAVAASQRTPSGPIKAVVPALGLGSEVDCYATPVYDFRQDKLTGFYAWLSRGVPVVQATLNDAAHTDFTGDRPPSVGAPAGTDAVAWHRQQLLRAESFIVPWLQIWLRNDPSGYPQLIAAHHAGEPTTLMLSDDQGFESAAYLPKVSGWDGIFCYDLRLSECGPTRAPAWPGKNGSS